MSLRDLYYSNKYLFPGGQGEVDRAVSRLCKVLNTTRDCISVHASPRGRIFGPITINDHYCGKQETVGISIGRDMAFSSDVKISVTGVRCIQHIIVVEKEAVFDTLVQSNLATKISAIFLTSKGFPSVAARALLRRLVVLFHCSVTVLTDFNPPGLQIALTYRNGGGSTSGGAIGREEAQKYAIPRLVWLGLHSEQVKSMIVGSQQQLPSRRHRIRREREEEDDDDHDNDDDDDDDDEDDDKKQRGESRNGKSRNVYRRQQQTQSSVQSATSPLPTLMYNGEVLRTTAIARLSSRDQVILAKMRRRVRSTSASSDPVTAATNATTITTAINTISYAHNKEQQPNLLWCAVNEMTKLNLTIELEAFPAPALVHFVERTLLFQMGIPL